MSASLVNMFYIFLTLFVVCLGYKWLTKDFDYFEKIGIPFERPVPLAGNMLDIILQRRSLIELTRKSYENYKKSK